MVRACASQVNLAACWRRSARGGGGERPSKAARMRSAQAPGSAGGGVGPGAPGRPWKPGEVAGDHRRAAGERFEHREAEPLRVGGEEDEGGGGVEAGGGGGGNRGGGRAA